MNRKQLLTLSACIILAVGMATSGAAQAKKGGKAAAPAKAAPAAAAPKGEAASNVPSNADALDLNSATLEKLMTLNGIDIVIAKKIAAGRPYKDKKDVVTKKILTAEGFNKIARAITVKAPEKAALRTKR